MIVVYPECAKIQPILPMRSSMLFKQSYEFQGDADYEV